ncbi:phage portal protein [Pediococcus ethanolidurans]|uniref:phage portal protein n=1 Tax=Pediococcus ethanolidurans TaxID=319653 RepID=UPI002952F2D3|nr:phage portal protein [Pediococcus ethanolidurans]
MVVDASSSGIGWLHVWHDADNKLRFAVIPPDQVYNGFANDIADVQQVILVLTNYGGTDLDEFMDELRKHHAIKMDTTMPGDQSGVDKLTIDIPVEARKNVLDLTFDNIFTYGQAVNPNKLQLGNNTGVALKMMYANLELKANTVESWFRKGVAELIRIILNDLNVADYENVPINQTWTRASIRNDVEQTDMINKLSEVTSKETVAKNNPLVDDWQEELDNLQHDKDEEAKQPDPFAQPNTA